MTNSRLQQIEQRLNDALLPLQLLVKDQSHLHAGHAGAKEGMGHYDVRIVSAAFVGQTLMQRHRLIYDALGDMMETDIHALKIRAEAPDDA